MGVGPQVRRRWGSVERRHLSKDVRMRRAPWGKRQSGRDRASGMATGRSGPGEPEEW